jgi:hypothetical protein
MAQQRLTDDKTRQRLQQRAVFKEKHRGKTPEQITNADVLEWAKQEMLSALGLNP